MAVFRRSFRRRHNSLFAIPFILFAFLIVAYLIFVNRMLPVLQTLAINKAKLVATYTVNQAVTKVLQRDDITYDKLMTLEKNSNGDILAVEANTMQINHFRYDVTNEIINQLNDLQNSNFGIPVGTVVGGPIFTNQGPQIRIDFRPVGNVETDLTNDFSSTGINQTRQEISLEVKTSISIIISSSNVSTTIESSIPVADTVIVGKVPDHYTVVEDGSSGKSSSDKIFQYDPNQRDES